MGRWLGRLTVLAMLGVVTPAMAAEPVAFVISIQRGAADDARVQTATETRPAETLHELHAGDQVLVGANARVVVLYHPGARTETVTTHTSPLVIRPAAATGAPDGHRMGRAFSKLARLVEREAPTYRPMHGRQLAPLVLVSPRNTRVFADDLAFQWQGQGEHELRLRNGTQVLWKPTVQSSPVAYPATEKRLTAGVKYRWELQRGSTKAEAAFEIVPADEAQAVRRALAEANAFDAETQPLARTAIYVDHGLLANAIQELERATASADDDALHRLLGGLYTDVGLTEHAARAFSRVKSRTAGHRR